MKKCSKCKKIKPKTEYHKQNCKLDGLRFHCKMCRSLKSKTFYRQNKETILQNNKRYYKLNRDEIQTKNKIYYDNKYHTDINFKLAHILRTRLNGAIKNNQKAGSAVDDLGCSIEELKIHLESQFTEGMNWGNHGLYGWHIDHIIPLSGFDLTNLNELKKACNYNNLQPLWAEDNLKKNKH